MKLLRLKITDPKGFRSLQPGFEYLFRNPLHLQEKKDFAPFVCAGPNGSGKSNLLEVLAAIFYQLEIKNISFRPSSFEYDEETNPKGYREEKGIPDAFELEYLIHPPEGYIPHEQGCLAHIKVVKEVGVGPQFFHLNIASFKDLPELQSRVAKDFLPDFILGYSSGENEILSLPFFKMRFVQYDEYWQALSQQLPYPGRPESRQVFLDNSFSQAILLCNLLFQNADVLTPFRQDVGIDELKEFRIIIKRSIPITRQQAAAFTSGEYVLPSDTKAGHFEDTPAIYLDPENGDYRLNLLYGLDRDKRTSIIEKLKNCATCHFIDDETDTLYLDYYVNDATKDAFKENFDDDPITLFQAFQILLTLNLYTVSDRLKADLYQSDSHYVSETIPTLASDERIMRFKFVKFSKVGIEEPVMLKSLSDGEHQLLHALGLCLLFKNTQSLFLLDEPETHFNPDWRANFITRLRDSFEGSDGQEMLITTHTPFLISDSKPERVLEFKKDKETGEVNVKNPEYNTLGASINKITMATFDKRETIGGHAQAILEDLRQRFEQGEDKERIIAELNLELGDSVEKIMLIKTILDSMEVQD